MFFFARLWRRAGILTDLEFIELRYSGRPAAFLRCFRACYTGFALNLIVMGWVNLALIRIFEVLLPGWNAPFLLSLCLIFTLLYVCIGGLRGLVLADAFQFSVALGASILLAFYALGSPAIVEKGGLEQSLAPFFFDFFPSLDSQAISLEEGKAISPMGWGEFLAYALILWWASWYPGSEPGGGGYITQRILSARDEKQGFLAALWFVIAHYCVRSWPWILAALAAAALYPELEGSEKEAGFVYLIRDLLPSPAKGLLFAAFLGAYMSTLSTHLNWGASYLMNDLYMRFLARQKSERHYLLVSRSFIVLLGFCSLLVSFYLMSSIQGAWSFLLECTAGIGFVLILRWYWWRITVWAEFAAMLVPPLLMLILHVVLPSLGSFSLPLYPQNLFLIVPVSILIILLVCCLGPQEDKKHLKAFYERISPAGPGWRPFSKEKTKGLGRLFLCWVCGIVLVYSLLFLVGALFFKTWFWILLCASLALLSSLFLFYVVRKEFRT